MLNNNINPMMNNINPNMMFNPMMMMNQMMNQNMNKEIKLIIKADNKIDVVSCFENDYIYTLKNKLNSLKFNEGYLIYNYQVLASDLTLKFYGIGNGSIIYVKPHAKNLIFKTTNGYTRNFCFDEDCPLSMAITIYCYENQINNFYEKINEKGLSFIFNSTVLRITDETPVKLVFGCGLHPNIIVNDINNLIGG